MPTIRNWVPTWAIVFDMVDRNFIARILADPMTLTSDGPDQYTPHLVALCGSDSRATSEALSVIQRELIAPIVRRCAARHPRAVTIADAIQDVWIKVLAAAKAYDASRPAAPYLATLTRRRLATLLAESRSHKRSVNYSAIRFADTQQRAGNAPCSSDVTLADIIPDPTTRQPHEVAETREDARRELKALSDILSEYERRAFLAYSQGYTYAEIAHSMDVSSKSVDNAIERVKKKISLVYGDGQTVFRRHVSDYAIRKRVTKMRAAIRKAR